MDAAAIALVLAFSLIFTLIPPILDGVERKIRARIQSRIGPPTILQTWYDINKLLFKELKIPVGSEYLVLLVFFKFILSLLAALYSAYIISGGILNPIYMAVLLVLITAIHNVGIVSSASSSNPFSMIGIYRGVILILLNEMGLLVSAIGSLWAANRLASGVISIPLIIQYILSLVILWTAAYVGSGRPPYDIHEAETELASGSLIEFSGLVLGLYIYSHLILRFLLSILVASTTMSFIAHTIFSKIILVILAIIVHLVYGIVASILGRTRIDLAVESLFTFYIPALIVYIALMFFE